MLKAFELVPEAYRKRFRTWRKGEKQTHLELAYDLAKHFDRWCAALEVSDYNGLRELVVLEQFKNALPEHIANYIGDQKVKTAAAAAPLADEYVLRHKRAVVERRLFSQHPRACGSDGHGDGAHTGLYSVGSSVKGVAGEATNDCGARSREQRTCNYCNKKGYLKADCYALKAKANFNLQSGSLSQPKPKGASMAVSVPSSLPSVVNEGLQVDTHCQSSEIESYRHFLSDGFVSMVGSDIKIPVKILRDTAAYDTFIEATVLPFTESDTGSSIPVLGLGLNVLHVPMHNIMLYSNLFQGQAFVGVRPALPVEGVDVILGNGLAGARVWADVPPQLEVDTVPVVRRQPDDDQSAFPEVFTACAVTRAMAREEAGSGVCKLKNNEDKVSVPMFSLSDFPRSVSQDDLKREQKADLSLKSLFEQVGTDAQIESSARGYFLNDGLLVRKWVPHGENFVGDPIVQIVLPEKFRESVLKVAHEGSGHFGVRKTYDRVLRYFFWPRLKRDVSTHVKTCHTCQLTSKPNQIL